MHVVAIRLAQGLNLRLRLSILRPPSVPPLRNVSHWTHRCNNFSPFSTKTSMVRFSTSQRALWLLPAGGGLGFYLLSNKESTPPNVFSSPAAIPPQLTSSNTTLFSPLEEEDRPIVIRIIALLRNNIWEPLLTTKRFIYLFVLFFPVLLSTPMLLVGRPDKRLKGDRWGAIWWYDLLVRRMEAAGPTFIKVNFHHITCQLIFTYVILVGPMGCYSG